MRRVLLAAALAHALAVPAGAVNWYVGDGRAGAMSVAGPVIENSLHTNVTAAVAPGASTVTVSASGSFLEGDLVLIIQTFGGGAGTYELARLSGPNVAGNIRLTTGTKNGYSVPGAQVLTVKEYESVTQTGGPWQASPFDGDSGGVFAIAVRGSFVQTAGRIDVTGAGFRGGMGAAATGGNQGDGTVVVPGGMATSQNGNGGGGGGMGANGGGGGGHGAAGTLGVGGGSGNGGNAAGGPSLSTIFFGGGGGGGGFSGGTGGNGGRAGGIVLIFAGANVSLGGGGVLAQGVAGLPGGASGGGGGGAGGAIRIVSTGTVTLGTSIVIATGSVGGTGGSAGGAGATGRVGALSLASVTGTANPGASLNVTDTITFDDPFTAPAAVTDLRVTAITALGLGESTRTITLQWTSPGADAGSTVPLAGFFSLRASTGPISNLVDFATATFKLDVATMAARGSLQTVTIANLYSSHTYFFAIRSTDSHAMTAPLSNLSALASSYILQPFAAQFNTWGAAWGDMDGDGDLDAVFTQDDNVRPWAYENLGGGAFNKRDLGINNRFLRGLALGDFDRDGDLDFIGGQSGPDILYGNTSGWAFSEVPLPGSATQSNSVAAADLDNDGDLDVVVGQDSSAQLDLHINNGNGTFVSSLVNDTTFRVIAVVAADYDGDGDMDIGAAVFDGANPSFVMRNDGSLTFTRVNLGAASQNSRAAAWGDYDQDGDLDLAIGRNNQMVLYENRGGDSFFERTYSGPGDANGAAWGDTDGDGDLDLIITGSASGPESVWRNEGNHVFTQRIMAGTGDDSTAGALGDFDDDLDLDLALANQAAGPELVFRNDQAVVNARPTFPTLTAADIDFTPSFTGGGSTLTFKWDGGSYDGPAATTTLNYEVAVATMTLDVTPSGFRIFPLSAPTRFVVAPHQGSPLMGQSLRPAYKVWPGDSSFKHGVFLSSKAGVGAGVLSYGSTYYFRVQTIDAGLVRSTWSNEVSKFLFDPCATRRSIASGPWSSPATWDWGDVPTQCSVVIVSTGTQVTVDITTATASTTTVYGKLSFSLTQNSSLTLVAGSLTVSQAATLELGTETLPIGPGVSAALVLASGTFGGQYGLIVEPGGRFFTRGASKNPWGYASASIGAGALTLSIPAADAALWAVGDEIIIGPTDGVGLGSAERRVLTSVTGTDPMTLGWVGGTGVSRVLTPDTPIAVGNLSRNVLIRSSGTVRNGSGANSAFVLIRSTGAADAVLSYAEFAFLGANLTDQRALQVHGGVFAARAEISSCAVRDGYWGVEVQNAVGVKLERNVLAGNTLSGLALYALSDGARVTRNLSLKNGSYGADVESAPNGVLHGNVAAANASGGFRNAQSSGTAYSSNTVHGNGGVGLIVTGFQSVGVSIQGDHLRHNSNHGLFINNTAARTLIEGVRSSSNTQRGLYIDADVVRTRVSRSTFSNNTGGGVLSDGTLTTLFGNSAYQNGSFGFSVENDSQTVVGNRSFANTGGARGFWVTNGSHTFIDNHVWANTGAGVFVQQASSVVWVGGALGYTPDGTASANSGGELLYDSGSSIAMNMELKGVRADLGSLNLDGMKAGNSLSAYQLSYDTGTLRVWGDWAVSGRGFRLDYSSRTWSAAHSLPVVMGGSNGHLAFPTSLSDANAVSQLVVIERRAGQWHVDGSVSGPDMATFSGTVGGLAVPAAQTQFLLTFTEAGLIAAGDRVEFALVAASDDADRPKQLLVGPSAPTFNEGKSRIGVAASAAFELRGLPGFPTRMDRLTGTSTYYTFVDSGPFTAVNSSISNVDGDGLQLILQTPHGDVFLATTTFDDMGVGKATGSYVTLTGFDMTASATYYGLTFGNSRSTVPLAAAYNIRALGAGPFPRWTLRRWSGFLGGEGRDDDATFPVFDWAPFRPGEPGVSTFTAITTFSITSVWTPGGNDASAIYEVQANTYAFANGGLRATFTYAGFTAPVDGLSANTSYFLRVFAAEQVGPGPYDLEFSPELNFPATATLATPPTPTALPFLGVFETSAAVAWAAHPSAPLSSSTYGYALEASSTNFNGAGLVYSSATDNVFLSTLSVGGPGGLLERNTTYYFRVGSRNWFGVPNFTALGASVTLTNTVAAAIANVFVTSVTASWPPLPAAPPSASAQGYRLEASSTNFAGGAVFSSATSVIAADRLTVDGLTPYVTYYFRVGTLNWNGAANYAVAGATVPTTFKRAPMPATVGNSVGAAWADYDKDGDLDALVANAGTEDEFLLRNDGGTLVKVPLTGTGGDSRGVAWGDYDNDGDLDALVASQNAQDEFLLRNDGGGVFTKVVLTGTGQSSEGVAWGDYDNDADLDALVANRGTEDEYLLRNDGGMLVKIPLPGTGGDSVGVAWGDYDNDGDLDALVANGGTEDEYLLRNDGGTLTKVALTGTGGDSRGVAWADYDNDGDLDALVANELGQDEVLLRNDGGTLVKVPLTGTGGLSVGVSWGDFDNDGDLDSLVANRGGQDKVLLRNDGGGVLTKVGLTGTGDDSWSASWGDYDNDGDLDALVANTSAQDEMLLRNDITAANSGPLPPSGGFNAVFREFAPFSSSGTLTMSWGDGSDVQSSTSALDYFVRVGTTVPGSSTTYKVPSRYSLDGYSGGGSSFYSTRQGAGRGLKLVLNKETTAYWAVTTQDTGFARSAESAEQSTGLAAPRAVTDLRVAAQVSTGLGASTMSVTLAWTAPGADGTTGLLSGVYDLRWSSKTPLTSTSAYVAAQYSVQIVTAGVTPGASQFYTLPNLDTAATWYFALSTLDSQTDPQGVRSGLSNPATAQAYVISLAGTGGSSYGVAWADYDKDGDSDALVANGGTEDEYLLRNDGGGVFSKVTLAGTGGDSQGVAWADYDNDGDLDALVVNRGTEDEYLLRNDSAILVKVPLPGTAGNSTEAAWADYDNDGDLDALVANTGTEDEYLLRNDGGTLVKMPLTGTGGNSIGVAWGDYDNDGDLDALVANAGTEDEYLLRNDGGTLVKVPLTGTGGNSLGAAWGDYDNDGDLDALVANGGTEDEYLLRNDAGTLTPVVLTGTGGNSYRVAWGDYDNDGDLDALVANYIGQDEVLLRNDGGGVLTKVVLTGTGGASLGASWGDYDNDGDLDALVANDGAEDEVLLRNDVSAPNPPPSAPTPLAANLSLAYDQSGATLTVRWDPGADGAADTDTINYQLAIATSPMTLSGDSKQITAPAAFPVPWAFGSPSFGSYPRPAFRTWPGTLVPQHGRQLRVAKTGGTLTNGTTYYIRLQAVDSGLARSAWSAELSTFVFAAIPAGGRAVSSHLSSMTVTYSTVASATAYFVEAFSDAGYTALVSSAGTADLTRTSVSVSALAFNTTYYLRVGTLYDRTTAYAAAVPAAAVTLATRPAFAAQTFSDVGVSSMTVSWASGGNPPGTRYVVLLSTANPYFGSEPDNVSLTTAPSGPLSVTLQPLKENTSYYLYVRPYNHAGFEAQDRAYGSSTTLLNAPQSVYFDEVTTTTILAAAYSPTPAFPNLDDGLSATNVSIGGTYDPTRWHGERWTVKAVMPTGRWNLGLGVADGLIYAVGGHFAGSNRSENQAYDPATNAWTNRQPMPTPATELAVAGADGRVYFMGGYSGPFNQNYVYEPLTNAWSARANMLTGRFLISAAALDGRVYVAGGAVACCYTFTDTAERFDPVANAWSALPNIPNGADYQLRPTPARGKLYLVGGTGVLPRVFDPAAGTWSVGPAAGLNQYQGAAATVGGKVYVVGGGGASSATVSEFDPAVGSWTYRASMPTARDVLAAAAYDGRLYAIGGGVAPNNQNEQYDPGTVLAFKGLLPNTAYAFRAKARNQLGVETAETTAASTFTLAFATRPAAGADPFTAVFASSVTLSWSSGTAQGGYNGPGATYLAQASTSPAFATLTVSSLTLNPYASLQTLAANATFHFRLRAVNSAGVPSEWVLLGSTQTQIEAPTTVYFDEVTTHSIVAVASAPGGAFTGLGVPVSALNIASGGVFAGWVQGSSVAVFSGLFPNTPYSFKAKARNSSGRETAETLAVSTYTLAFATVPAGPAFTTVLTSAVAVAWSSGATAAGASFLLQGSTMASFTPLAGSSTTFNPFATVPGLLANATHYFRVSAHNLANVPNDWVLLGATVTLANPAVSAASTFTMVGASSMTVAWGANGNAPGTSYDVVLATYSPSPGAPAVSTAPTGAVEATLTGLFANATYYLTVTAYNRVGAATPPTALGSTVTRIETPTAVYFDAVTTHSIVAVASAPGGAFTGLGVPVSALNIASGGVFAGWVQGSSVAVFSSLSPNTPYAFKAKARNVIGVETAETVSVTTYTLAAATFPAGGVFVSVGASSASVQWAPGSGTVNGPGATYLVQASTLPSFIMVAGSSLTGNVTASVPVLSNATHYFRVRAYNSLGVPDDWLLLGSTLTAIETPTSVYFDAVTTHSVVAVASAPGGAFTGLGVPVSALNIASGGVFAGWVQGSSVAVFSGLSPNTPYAFKAKARNVAGMETGESAGVSTFTLAATPLSAGTTFLAVYASSVQFQWAADGNPGGTEYRVHASSAGDYNVAASSRASAWFTGVSTSLVSLSPYTTWYFRVQARNGNGVETAYTVLGATLTPLFFPVSLAGTGGDSYGARWGDFDADGDLDLLVANFAAGASAVLRNDGGGVFTKLLVAGAPAALDAAWGDFDGDGDLDIAFANYSGDEAVARYDGGTTFTMITLTGTGGATRGVAWGDYDNDGDLDLAIGNDSGQDEVVARNDGGGAFTPRTLSGTGGSSMGVAWGDADNDGDLDLLVFNALGANEVLARNDGGAFTAVPLPGTGGDNLRGAWADYDADGDLDFAAGGYGAENDYLARNDGAGSFTVSMLSATGASAEDVSWGDFDGDGDPDLIVANSGGPAYLLRNEGAAFTRLDVTHPAGQARAARWGDYDGDGDLDVALADRAGSTDEVLLRNEAQTANPAPSAPSVHSLTLESGVVGATLTLRWDPATDGGAATAALNYALVVATAPMTLSGDSLRVVSPSSFVVAWNQGLVMGDRNRPAFKVWPGGAGPQHGIPFKLDAPNVLAANFKSDATYYFRLQTIDAGLKRGAWGAEISSYVFRAEPPAGRAVFGTGISSFTVSYATVGASSYLVEGSTASDFSGTLHRSSTSDLSLSSLTLTGLSANTTYHLRMGSLWRRTTAYAAAVPAVTPTSAAVPGAAAEAWLELHESSAVVAWLRNGNPVGVTTYTVVASTGAGFPNTFLGNRTMSTAPVGNLPQGVLTGLAANTTYYLHIAAVNHAGVLSAYATMSATATRIEAPTDIVFDAVSSMTLLARATSAAGGFSNLAIGTSAVNFARDGLFQGWVLGSSVTLSTGLTPNTLYAFKAKARNLLGVETQESPVVSTYTFAAVPSSATPTVPDLGVSSISLQWTHNGNPAGTQFLVGVSTDPAFGTGTVLDSGFITAFSSAILGLMPNSTYYAAVLARNAYGIETATRTLGSTVTYAADPASAASTWTAVSSVALTAAWDANGNPVGTRFEAVLSTAALPNALPANLIVSTYPYGSPAVSFAALTPDTTYYLSVRAVNHTGIPGVRTILGSTITLASPPVPSTAPFAGIFLTSMTVQWSSGMNPAWTQYRVDAATSSDYGGTLLSTSWEAFTSTTVSGLGANTTYHLRVVARNGAGTRTAFLIIGATATLAYFPIDGGTPFPTVGLSSLTLSWLGGGNPTPTAYEAVLSTNASLPDASADETRLTTGSPAGIGFGGLTANTTYYLFARALNRNSVPTAWTVFPATATPAAVPGAAGTAFSSIGQSSMTLAWTLGGNAAGTEFLVRGSTSAAMNGQGDVSSGFLTGLTTTFLVLAPDATYYWRVAARGHSGSLSPPLDPGARATLAYGPAASTEPFHSVGVTSVTVQWLPNGNPATTLYDAQTSTAQSFGGTLFSSGWTTNLSTSVAGLSGDTTYYWRVRARGAAGVLTEPLALGTTATLTADPQGAQAVSVGPSSVFVAWGAGGNREADSAGVWTTRTPLPSARERHAGALVGGRVYSTGGLVGGVPSAEVWSVGTSPSGALGTWRREADLPAARESHALAVYAGRLYVLGGFDGSAKSTVYSADLSPTGVVAAWRAETSLPAARFKLAAAASGGWLYAFGGDNGAVSQATVYRAPLAADGRVGAWATTTALPSARNSHAAAISSGRVYVAGGLGAGVAPEVWSAALNGPAVGTWRTETPLAVPVFRHQLLAGGGSLVLVGGHDGTGPVADIRSATLASNGAAGEWRNLGAMPLARFGHAAALETSNVFVLGGADDTTVAADTLQAALGGTEYLLERAEDVNFTINPASSNWRRGAGAELAGLTPNKAYFLRVHARSRSGFEGTLVVAGSTLTPAAVPGSAASTFTLVEAGSATVAWADGGNPAGTEFTAGLSTSTDFTTVLVSSWTTALSSTVYGLSPNTTYYVAVMARDSINRQTREVPLGSTVTAAAVPQTATFPAVATTGLTVQWSTAGNPAGTRYEAQLSASASFAPLAASSVTLSSGASFANLLSATTYYLRVRGLNSLGTPSAFSAATQTVTGADFTPPAAVTGLGLHATDTPGVLLSAWMAPGDDANAGPLPAGSRFYLQWTAADPASFAWSTATAQLAPSTGPVLPGALAAIPVTGLPVGSTIYARVWTADESLNISAFSSTAAAWVSPFTLVRLDGVGVDAGRWTSVTLDRAGDAHVAYTAGTIAQEMRYLKRTAGVWSVAEAPDPGVPAEGALVAVDGAGIPHVVYRNSSTGQLRAAKRSSGWSVSAVAGGNLHPGGLAVDATSFAHISYYDAGLPGLRYARWDGAAWQLSTVDAGAGLGRHSSLALAPDGTPHIAYYDAVNGDLKYASRTTAGAWQASTVDSAGVDVGSAPVLSLDGLGRSLVFYVDATEKDLKQARFNGSAWVLTVVDGAADVTGVGGAALDGAGRATVSYYDGTAADLRLARHDGANWDVGAIDSFGSQGAWSGLAVEADGGLLEVHYDAAAGDLKAGNWGAGLSAPLGGNPRGRVQAPSAFGGVPTSATSIQWAWTDSASNELGWRLYGGPTSTGPFSVVADSTTLPATAGTGTQRLYTETGLTQGTTYFRYVAAVSSGGAVVSPMAALFPYVTVDLTAPAVVDNQAGDVVWRRAAGALYNVDFTDSGGAALSSFTVKASSVAGGAGPDLVAFTTVAVSILSDSYTADWALPPAVFAALQDAATNFITVRVVDGNGNATTAVDVFTVLKDTTPPALADNQADDPVLRAVGGTAYDVDAFDAASGLSRFQYSVSTAAVTGDGGAVGWTDIPLGASSMSFVADWTLAFAGLKGDATNYVSVRAVDRAGSTTTLLDAFSVLKDTGGPRVSILTPGTAAPSVLSALAGTASDRAGVGAVQVAIQDAPPGGSWFDGAGFTSGDPLWLAASGTAAWTFSGVPAWVDGGSYRVAARATDGLGNLSVANSTSDFTMDASTPTAAVTVPANGAVLAALPSLSGTASDPGAAPSGLLAVELRVRRASDGLYWNWPLGAWGVESSTSPTLASPWTLPVPASLRANLAHGASYFVSARAVDNAVPANVGTFVSGSTFSWTDTVGPSPVTDLAASSGTAPGTLQLAWTAPGDDGTLGDIALGQYRIHYSTDPAFSASSSAAQVAFSTANVKPGARHGRLVSGLSAGTTFYVRVFLADDAGNWSTLSNGATAYAGIQPLSHILGHVQKSSSEGVTAVQVEAYDAANNRISNTFTLADGSGTFDLSGIPDGVFRIQASWTADDITSSVWLDNVAVGTGDVLFMLEINYTLSTLTGTLGVLSAQASSPAGFLVRASDNNYAEARVELLRGGTPVAGVRPDPTGRWTISNLLPGKYAVRAFNGLEYTDPQDIQLGEGETQEVVFVFDPLPEAAVFAFPNPARSQTTFRFVSALPGLEAQVTVFDIAGVLVKEIPGSAFVAKPGGVYHADWDLTNDNDESVASGVYLFMVKVKGSNGQSGKIVKKLAVVR